MGTFLHSVRYPGLRTSLEFSPCTAGRVQLYSLNNLLFPCIRTVRWQHNMVLCWHCQKELISVSISGGWGRQKGARKVLKGARKGGGMANVNYGWIAVISGRRTIVNYGRIAVICHCCRLSRLVTGSVNQTARGVWWQYSSRRDVLRLSPLAVPITLSSPSPSYPTNWFTTKNVFILLLMWIFGSDG